MPKRTKAQRDALFERRPWLEVAAGRWAAQLLQARQEGRVKTTEDFTAEQLVAIEATLKRRLAERTCRYPSI
jgi:hypothetical protein